MKIVLTALFSDQYPAIGESHGLSVLAGQLVQHAPVDALHILDMVAHGQVMHSELLDLIEREQPHVVGLSVNYGTYSSLRNLVPRIRRILPKGGVIVYGGPLATYLADRILLELDEQGLVVVGEGELSFSEIVKAIAAGRSTLSDIPNLVFREAGLMKRTSRYLYDVGSLAVPYRDHLRPLIPQGIQLYAEASRGCSWSHCTFCLRQLLDIKGKPEEFRHMPRQRIQADLKALQAIGAGSVTFADEDFLGLTLSDAAFVTTALAERARDGLRFDASMRIESIVKSGELAERHAHLASLKDAGLRKVFLGVESGSPGQLKRYAKGHSTAHASDAIRRLRAAGIGVELGWIMFDPLCSLIEVRENISFLLENDAVDSTSSLFSELRLQDGTPFIKLLKNYETNTGVSLINGALDLDTLSYPYLYANREVASLMELVNEWSSQLRPIHYPLKNMTRYGVSSELALHIPDALAILSELRRRLCEVLLRAIDDLLTEQVISTSTKTDFSDLLLVIAKKILDWDAGIPEIISRPAILTNLADNCRRHMMPVS